MKVSVKAQSANGDEAVRLDVVDIADESGRRLRITEVVPARYVKVTITEHLAVGTRTTEEIRHLEAETCTYDMKVPVIRTMTSARCCSR
jgi:hypothetical protein